MSAMTESAPVMAAMVNATSPSMPAWLSAVPPMVPDMSTTNATPKLAPELIPSTDGSASGFLNTVCICKPLTESPAPATKAVQTCGKRDFQMMFSQLGGIPSFPVRMSHTALNGICTEPNARFKNIKSTTENRMPAMSNVFWAGWRMGQVILLINGNRPVRNPVTIPGGTL